MPWTGPLWTPVVGKCSEWGAGSVRKGSGWGKKDSFPGTELKMCLGSGASLSRSDVLIISSHCRRLRNLPNWRDPKARRVCVCVYVCMCVCMHVCVSWKGIYRDQHNIDRSSLSLTPMPHYRQRPWENVCVERLRNHPTTLRWHRPPVCCRDCVCACARVCVFVGVSEWEWEGGGWFCGGCCTLQGSQSLYRLSVEFPPIPRPSMHAI